MDRRVLFNLSLPYVARAAGWIFHRKERGGSPSQRRPRRPMSSKPQRATPDATRTSIQDRVNRRIYLSPGVDSYYHDDQLDVAEGAALLKHQPAVAGRRVLDIGVGPGRTTRFLAPLASDYLGIDYSPIMVESFRRSFPAVAVACLDMRDLSSLAADSIDFVLASCNVIDAVSHQDRQQVLGEVRRVMCAGGIFMFSSHNRDFREAFRGPQLRWSRSPCNQALHLLRFIGQQLNHRSTGKLRQVEREYALLDDIGHDFQLLHYYIDCATQIEQLARNGFATLEVYGHCGRVLSGSESDLDSPSLLYVATPAT